jgi:hypothetical protein
MKIYEVGGAPDWVCANSPEEAERVYREFLRDKISAMEIDEELEEFPPEELSSKQLDKYRYQYENDKYQLCSRSFRRELKERKKPGIFACSDY